MDLVLQISPNCRHGGGREGVQKPENFARRQLWMAPCRRIKLPRMEKMTSPASIEVPVSAMDMISASL